MSVLYQVPQFFSCISDKVVVQGEFIELLHFLLQTETTGVAKPTSWNLKDYNFNMVTHGNSFLTFTKLKWTMTAFID